jgi:hypothetical protein
LDERRYKPATYLDRALMPRKSIAARNDEQRERQADLRRRNREKRRPTRDDVARIVLWQAITRVHEKEMPQAWERIVDGIVDQLAEQGFDARESELVIEDLVQRYTSGRGGFRRKTHLSANQAADGEDNGDS